jgi:Bacterial Ig domain
LKNKIEKLTLTISFGIILLCIFPAYITLHVYAQQQLQQQLIGVKITSPSSGQQVPVGELTISGTSTDDTTTDCTVYADWNDQKPFQKTVATGPGGLDDYSNWTFTYTEDYHLITNGTNELTAKLSCLSNPTNLTKWNSVNVTGIEYSEQSEDDAKPEEGQNEQLLYWDL